MRDFYKLDDNNWIEIDGTGDFDWKVVLYILIVSVIVGVAIGGGIGLLGFILSCQTLVFQRKVIGQQLQNSILNGAGNSQMF